ncbi:UNVERIFIED_CONTAM: hypothetical protein K2H54_033602 [Gekko kuhli]
MHDQTTSIQRLIVDQKGHYFQNGLGLRGSWLAILSLVYHTTLRTICGILTGGGKLNNAFAQQHKHFVAFYQLAINHLAAELYTQTHTHTEMKGNRFSRRLPVHLPNHLAKLLLLVPFHQCVFAFLSFPCPVNWIQR